MLKFLSLFLLGVLLPLDAMAQTDHVSAQLISSYTGTGDLPVIDMALDIDLKGEFYTYWRMPGDNGLAPVMDWTGSTNVKDVAVSWPTPKRFTMFEMHSFGYSDGVMFPLEVMPQDIGKDIVLKLKLNLMVCHDICIPQTVEMMRIFGAGKADKSEFYDKIQSAKASLPSKENTDDLGIDTAILGKDAVVVTAYSKDGFGELTDMIVETPNSVLTSIPEIIPPDYKGDKTVLKIQAPAGLDLTKELFGKNVTITLINGNQAIEKRVAF